MIINIGTDSGKSFSKAVCRLASGEFITTAFPTSYEETEVKTVTEGCFEVKFEEKRYIVGETNRRCSEEKDGRSKEQFIHKICTLTAICDVIRKAKLMGAKTEEIKFVNITVNMPLSEYLKKEARENVVAYYNSGQKMSITVDGQEFSFVLNVLPYYEGLGAVLVNSDKYQTRRVVSLDFGSLNTGYVTLDKLRLVSTNYFDSGTIDFGCSGLLTKIKTTLKNNGIRGIRTDDQVLELIRGENDRISNEIVQLAKSVVKDHVQEIYQELIDLEVGVDSTDVLASGGAAYLYNEFFNDVFKEGTVIFDAEDSEFLNAKGSLKLLA